jgi:uncharacterized protein YecE (DUF72 family)
MHREAAAFRWRVLTSAHRQPARVRWMASPIGRAASREPAPGAREPDAAPARMKPRQPDLFSPQPDPAGAPMRSKPGPIRVGTSGFSFADWVGPFYPRGTRSGEMLDYYQRHFNTVEVNATYYRLPPPATLRRMAERTDPDFRFMVKLPGALTHQRDGGVATAAEFGEVVQPLLEAGKYAGALAQFPFSFRRSVQNEDYLRWLKAALPGHPLFVEFRHASWDGPDLDAILGALGLGFCSVDEPALAGLFPRRAASVGPVAYVRFHGRNAGEWWSGGAQRYDYLYSRAELEPWAGLIRELAARAEQTYVFFNNCHAGQAVLNARMMEEILGHAAPRTGTP